MLQLYVSVVYADAFNILENINIVAYRPIAKR
jgi:hypothetical protein